jgi:hypothetical protein
MNKKNYDPSANGIKQRKERKTKEDCMKKKGEKSHKDLNVSYHAIDEPSLAVQMCFDRQNFLPDIFSITANLLLYIAAIIMMFKKSSHKRNQGKEKKRNRCMSSSLGKDLFILRTPPTPPRH